MPGCLTSNMCNEHCLLMGNSEQRSSDGVTKVQSDSLSSDPPPPVKTHEVTSGSVTSKNKSPAPFPSSQGSPFFPPRGQEESSSSTLSNSIPGIRPKALRFPLDEYLPRQPKREDTFIKSRDPPLRNEAAFFRKIESLLKDSLHIREPILNCAVPIVDVHDSTASSLSTEEIVAAEFYKATYGTPKKTESQPKSKGVPSPNRGAGDWVVPWTQEKREELTKRGAQEPAKERATSQPIQCDCPHRATAASPKSALTESYHQEPNRHTIEPFGGFNASNDFYEDIPPAEEGLVNNNVSEVGESTKMKLPDAHSVSSGPSTSVQTSCRRPHKIIHRPVKKTTVQNASINTDRLNSHVFNIKHAELNDIADDCAHLAKNKSFVVQELPKVNIRARLVKQSCGVININPVVVTKLPQNTAVVEVNHVIDEPHHQDAGSPKKTKIGVEKGLPNERGACTIDQQPREKFVRAGCPNLNENTLPGSINDRQPAMSHRFAFDDRSDFGSTAPTKPKIFDTIDHFKKKLSNDFNTALDPVKRSLTAMMESLNEFCKYGLDDVQVLQTLASSSKEIPPNLSSRVEQMDDLLTDELNAWGQRDATHYNLLRSAFDELTKEIKTVVKSYNQQQSINKRMQSFLEGSISSALKDRQGLASETIKVDQLYAIDYLLQRLASVSHFPNEQNSNASETVLTSNLNNRRETFIIPAILPHVDQSTQVSYPRENTGSSAGESMGVREEYEDDFIPEEKHLSESDLNSTKSHSEKINVAPIKPNYPRVDDNVVQLRTSGSGNGVESSDGPVRLQEDPPLSIASTINVSQAKEGLIDRNPPPKQGQLIKSACDLLDKPTVRLTNKNTKAVFELRLPEQMENLSSTITYNSGGCNDEIKLSIGSKHMKDRNDLSIATPVSTIPRPDGRSLPGELTEAANLLPGPGQPPLGLVMDATKVSCKPVCLPSASSFEVRPPVASRVTLRNQATQFPSNELSVESLSADLLTLFETKMNEIVENSKQKLTIGPTKCSDFNVQVAIEEDEARWHQGELGASNITVATPCKTPQMSQNSEATPVVPDGYDSHPTNLERPSDFLLTRQTEKEIELMLNRSSTFPAQMESTPSSMSVPTSLSDLGKRWSSSSSELAFPLGSEVSGTLFNAEDIRHLRPAPGLTDVPVAPLVEASQDGNYIPFQTPENGEESTGGPDHSDRDISTHLHPNPYHLPALQLTPGAADNDVTGSDSLSSNDVPLERENRQNSHKCQVLDVQPYDSDLMSEGEVGYIYTSNSYSSGEVIEKKKHHKESSRDNHLESAAVVLSEAQEERAELLEESRSYLAVINDTCVALSSNEDNSSSETTSTTASA